MAADAAHRSKMTIVQTELVRDNLFEVSLGVGCAIFIVMAVFLLTFLLLDWTMIYRGELGLEIGDLNELGVWLVREDTDQGF